MLREWRDLKQQLIAMFRLPKHADKFSPNYKKFVVWHFLRENLS